MSDNTPQSAKPGFYPDESGTSRYWDGNGWTDQTQGASPSGTTMTANPKADAKAARAYAKATRPWFKKKRWWVLIIVVVAIIASVAGAGGSSDDGPQKVGGDSSAAESGSKDSGDQKAGSKSNPIKVGETVKLQGTKYTVESVNTSAALGGQFLEEKANGVYVVVELTIENTKDETKTFSESAAKFVGSNNKRYSTDNDGTFAAIGDNGETLIFEDMQPDVPKTGLLVFDVPKALTKGGLLEVGDLFGRGEAYINLGL